MEAFLALVVQYPEVRDVKLTTKQIIDKNLNFRFVTLSGIV